jgi:hypothetical protein
MIVGGLPTFDSERAGSKSHGTAHFPERSETLCLHNTNSHRTLFSRRAEDCTYAIQALQVLAGHEPAYLDHVQDQASSNEDLQITRARSRKLRRQGKNDWREALTDNTLVPARQGLVIATCRVYGLGDRSAGYWNGAFVTDLVRTKPREHERKEGRARSFFFCSRAHATARCTVSRKTWLVFKIGRKL